MKKKLLGFLLVFVLAGLCSVTAMADAYCDPSEAYAGSKVIIDGFVDADGNDCPDYGTEYLAEYYALPRDFTKGSDAYIEKCAIDKKTGEVYIIIKSQLPGTKEKSITGTITLRERESGIRYVATLEEGDLVVNPGGGSTSNSNASRMEWLGDREFGLPYDYDTKAVRFETDTGDTYGKLRADFDVAYFNVTVVDQKNLFLGYHTTANSTVEKKYSNAYLKFITWSATPTFDVAGTLGIYMDSDEWIYGVKSDGTLYKLNGSYNTNTGAYEIKTATLGSYVISDRQLSVTGTAATSSQPPASSSVAPPPVSVAPSSSSVAPPPASSSESSSSESSESSEPASLPESSQPSSSTPESSKPTEGNVDEEKGGFPLVPVLIGVLAVLVIALAFLFFGSRKKKPKFDDWDD